MNSTSESRAAKSHALFANLVKDTDTGWRDIVLQGSLHKCLAFGNEFDGKWTGEAVRSPNREQNLQPLRAIPSSLTGGPFDVPETFHILLSLEKSSNLALLGGEHWVRSKLAHADSPHPLCGMRSGMAFLPAIADRNFPLSEMGEPTGGAEQFRGDGPVLAEFTIEAAPDRDWAVVLGISDTGHELLSGFTKVGQAESEK